MADEIQDTAVIEGTPQVRFLRNPENPTIYSPLIDIRTSQHGLHLLTFVPPAAAPADVMMKNGQPTIEIRSDAELLVPLDSVERVIRDLCFQFKNVLMTRLKRDAAAAGLEVPADDEIVFNGLEDIFDVGRTRPAPDEDSA